MRHLDGFYRHLGAAMTWDATGVSVSHPGGLGSGQVPWADVISARRLGGSPGHVQIIVHGHVPPRDPSLDPFSIAMASEDDANRIVTCLEWNVAQTQAESASA